MARGLSPLQQTILRLAHRNVAAGRRSDPRSAADAYYFEILAEHWGWPLTHGVERYLSDGSESRYDSRGEQHFSKKQIGAACYNAGMAALSRAVARLEARGLIERRRAAYGRWSGVNLTAAGIAVVSEST